MILHTKCNKILLTLRKAERLALSKGREGGLTLNNCDLILHFVDKYIAEREKNILLQQELEHQKQQMQNNNKVKTN